jgi:uncharacterized repeat protein (TIGR01451 family)
VRYFDSALKAVVDVGGAASGAGNVISGNDNGVQVQNLSGGSGPNPGTLTVAGNLIGTDASGETALPNSGSGVDLDQKGWSATIGGVAAGSRNVISGNGGIGVNVRSHLGAPGLAQVLGNFVGTDAAGSQPLGNGGGGVRYSGGSSGSINGNVISANTGDGLYNAGGVDVVDNKIGTDAAGTAALGNTGNGLVVAAPGATIGGIGHGNLVSANNGSGVSVLADDTTLLGNSIGTDVTGDASLGNGGDGVHAVLPADSTTGLVIGGADTGAGNLISGNNGWGINTTNPTSAGAHLLGNLIGTDAAHSTGIPNLSGGVQLNGDNSSVGGTDAGEGNVVAGNMGDGIEVFGSGTQILGNDIGVLPGGAPMGNALDGVVLSGDNNVVGGSAASAANVIAANGDVGVDVVVGAGNLISRNPMHDNGGIAIDLNDDGVTPNDAADFDGGPNNLQNFPIIMQAGAQGSTVEVDGALHSAKNTAYTIEFFANAACDSTGHGEGETYIGSDTLTTNGSGNATFADFFSSPAAQQGASMTATATDPSGNTSEFSACTPVGVGNADLRVTKTVTPSSVPSGGSATYTIRVSNLGAFTATNVLMRDKEPAALHVMSVTPSQGACRVAQTVGCNLGELALGETATVKIVVKTSTRGVYVTSAGAISDAPDPNPNNNVGRTSLRVT